MAPTTYTQTEDGVLDIEFDEEYISKKQFFYAIGSISAALASAAGAWDGNAPDWFPEPPEWFRLGEQALADSRPNLDDLLEESDAMVWAEAFVDAVHKNPSIAFDAGTMVGWFANAMVRGAWDEQDRERDRREHPLHYAAVDPASDDLTVIAIYTVASDGETTKTEQKIDPYNG